MPNTTDVQHRAKRQKKDEFYTRLSDIERELCHYTEHFRGKVVFCNCNDSEEGNFFRYLRLNFEQLGLKKLYGMTYSPYPTKENPALLYIGNGSVTTIRRLEEDGDFRSEESLEVLKQADIVVTNPPFSLFREYIAQLMEHEKKFLLIGHQHAMTYKSVFPLLKNGNLWMGYGFKSSVGFFGISKDGDYFYDEKYGEGVARVPGVVWFTNIDHSKRYEKLVLYKTYSSDQYPTYDNLDAINVDRVREIPKDFDGLMGVPITFFNKHNPEQFDIIRFRKGDDGKDLRVNGEECYFRVVIKRRV